MSSTMADFLNRHTNFQRELMIKSSIFEHCYLPNCQKQWQHIEFFQNSNEFVGLFNVCLGKIDQYVLDLKVVTARPELELQSKLDTAMQELKVEIATLEAEYLRMFFIDGHRRQYLPARAMRNDFVKQDLCDLFEQCSSKLAAKHAASIQNEKNRMAACGQMEPLPKEQPNQVEQVKKPDQTGDAGVAVQPEKIGQPEKRQIAVQTDLTAEMVLAENSKPTELVEKMQLVNTVKAKQSKERQLKKIKQTKLTMRPQKNKQPELKEAEHTAEPNEAEKRKQLEDSACKTMCTATNEAPIEAENSKQNEVPVHSRAQAEADDMEEIIKRLRKL